MENTGQRSNGGNVADYPIYSRLFILCDKKNNDDDIRVSFSRFGQIEEVKMVNNKGICFLQFSKTSEAARALEAMNKKVITEFCRPIKVEVAANPSDIETRDSNDTKYKRLFITVPKCMTEEDVERVFSSYGNILSISILRDQTTGESKGFAYVTYEKFSEAAIAYEICDKKYRALFAKPKVEKYNESNAEVSNPIYPSNNPSNINKMHASLISTMETASQGYTKVNFMCSPNFARYHYERLFDLIPGLIGFKFFLDTYENCGRGHAVYSNSTSAAYAVEKLNNFEYPSPGQFIYVKPDSASYNPVEKQIIHNIPSALLNLRNIVQSTTNSGISDLAQLTKAIAEAQKLVNAATGINDGKAGDSICSVPLPPPKPLADIDSRLAKRCFLVCKPSPPPLTVLRDVFSRFGDLINVYTLPNKTVGYARYASVAAADEAMKTLHGSEICGVRIKVLEADEEAPPRKRRYDY